MPPITQMPKGRRGLPDGQGHAVDGRFQRVLWENTCESLRKSKRRTCVVGWKFTGMGKEYLSLGWRPVPVPFGEKGPRLPQWQRQFSLKKVSPSIFERFRILVSCWVSLQVG